MMVLIVNCRGESDDANLLQKLISGQMLQNDEKFRFAEFVILMHLRSPIRQAELPELWSGVFDRELDNEDGQLFAEVVESAILKKGEPLTKEEKEDLYLVFVSMLQNRRYKMPDEIRLNSMLGKLPQSTNALLGMSWKILVAPVGSFFIASDNPVVFPNGLGNRDSLLLFPLCFNMALEARPSVVSAINFEHISFNHVNDLNHVMCRTATDRVFGRKADSQITQMMFDKNK